MGWDITGQHEVAQDGVGRGAQRGRAPYGADRLRARPGAAGGDTCCRAEQVLIKSQTPTRQKNPSATSSFTCKSIFFVVSLQMFNILIKVSRFSFLSKSDFGYFSLPDPAAITAKQCDFF